MVAAVGAGCRLRFRRAHGADSLPLWRAALGEMGSVGLEAALDGAPPVAGGGFSES